MSGDAEVIIKISGDTKNFDSKYAQLVKEYKNKEIDIEITAKDLELANSQLNEMNKANDSIENSLKEINNQIKEYENTIASLNEKNATLNRNIWEEKSLYLANLDTIKSLNAKIEAQKRLAYDITQENNKQLDAILKQYNVIDKIEGKYEKQKNDLTVIGQKIQEAGNVDLGSKIDNASKSISKTVKSVGKWGLAIFGVRSAYMGIRQVMSNVLSQNEGLGKQMTGLKNSLYAAFTPVVEKIINLIRTLMAYVNYIWQAFFKKDLFKNVAKSTEQTSKNLKSGASSAKEINKQLAGFDEANVLSNNKSSGGGVGGGSVDTGNISLGLDKVEIPKWLKWIRNFIEEHPKIAKMLFGLAGFTIFGMWAKNSALNGWLGTLLGKSGAGKLAAGASGLLGVLGTLALLVASVWLIKIDYDKLKELNKELDLLAESYARNKRWLKVIDEYQQEYNKGMAESAELTSGAEQATQGHIKSLTQDIITQNGNRKSLELSKKQLEETITAYSNKYKQGQLTEEQERSYAKFIRENLVGAFAAGADGASQMEEDLKALDKKYGTTYLLDIKEHGLDEFGSKLKQTGSKIDTFLKKWQQVGDKVLASFGMTASTYKAVFHADGGIVNMPGRGVPVAHYAGEAGREGLIPMDNESQMQLLGQAIAKYVNINNVVNNYMDARKINSILQASANNERLANNG